MAYEYLDELSEINRALDDRQKKACCRTDNTVVAAGAGSGKTQVLATRFAWLVMSRNIPVSKILTLTFTKKAAGEMYERIHSTLTFFAENPGTPQAEKERARNALSRFGEARIQTLDSYCVSIVRQAANRYGLRPDFSTGSADSERELKDAALPFILKHRENPAVKTFAEPGRLQDFAENIFARTIDNYASLADGDNFFSGRLTAQKETVCRGLNYFIFGEGDCPSGSDDDKKSFARLHAELEEALPEAFQKKAGEEYTKKSDLAFKNISGLLEKYGPITPDDIERYTKDGGALRDMVRDIQDILRIINSLPASGYTQTLRGAFRDFKATSDGGSFSLITALCNYITQYGALKELLNLLDIFHAQVKRSKRVSGKLSFRDVQKMALVILENEDDIRAQENAAYDKIMIDEFQDNNGDNKRLLFMLCSGPGNRNPQISDIAKDKLFFVGDEKQSIYKFRGADVAVFNELQDGFIKSFGEDSVLPMEYNYRSSGALISSFNILFGGQNGIFDSSSTEAYEAKYKTPTKKYNPQEKTVCPPEPLTKQSVPVHFCMLDEGILEDNDKLPAQNQKDFLGRKEQLAYFIADKISRIKNAAGDGLKYSDIAILDKSRTDRALIIKWLNIFGIPYSLDQNGNLFDSGIVFDIYNFLRMCVYPSDIIAFASFLTSPLCGLTENEAESILAVIRNHAEENTVFSALDDIPKSQRNLIRDALGGRDNLFTDAMDFYHAQRKLVLSQPLTASLETLWYKTGYIYETMLSKKSHMYSEQFDMLYELARQCDGGNKSSAWFVDQLAAIKSAEDRNLKNDDADIDTKDISYPIEKSDAVQILTIHKSKGLQYKHVLIYGCTGVRSKSDTANVFYEEDTGVSIRTSRAAENYFYLMQKGRAKKKELAEFRRLIYVAVTRAEKEVYIVGSTKKIKSEKADVSFRLLEAQADIYYPERGEDDGPEAGEAVYNDGAPFDYLSIMPVERDVLNSAQKDIPAGEKRRMLSVTLLADYENPSHVIKAEPEPVSRITPSSLEDATGADTLGNPRADPYATVNRIIERYSSPAAPDHDTERETEDAGMPGNSAFTYADFGTLAHSYLEAFAHGVPPEDFTPGLRLFKNLSSDERKVMTDACVKMVREFSASALGENLQAAMRQKSFVKAEYAFRTVLDDKLVTGTIDLIFRTPDGTYVIADYKTDRELRPGIYYEQQRCYRIAAERLLDCGMENIKCFLHYLRFNETLDITGALSQDAGTIRTESAEIF